MDVFMCAASAAFFNRYVFHHVTASTSASPTISEILDPSTTAPRSASRPQENWSTYVCRHGEHSSCMRSGGRRRTYFVCSATVTALLTSQLYGSGRLTGVCVGMLYWTRAYLLACLYQDGKVLCTLLTALAMIGPVMSRQTSAAMRQSRPQSAYTRSVENAVAAGG